MPVERYGTATRTMARIINGYIVLGIYVIIDGMNQRKRKRIENDRYMQMQRRRLYIER